MAAEVRSEDRGEWTGRDNWEIVEASMHIYVRDWRTL